MSNAVELPETIEDKLNELAAEVRRLRLLSGLSRLVLVLFVIPLVAIIADVTLELSGSLRGIFLAGWLGLGAAAAWWFVWRPLRNEIPHADLAAAIETSYPSLAERLRTLVELSEHAEPGNGSRSMMAILAKETDQRARKLNFSRVAPLSASLRMGILAILVGILALSPLLFLSGSSERVRRFLLPWYTPTVEVAHKVVVSSGDPVVKRGEPVTLSAYLERLKPNVAMPDAAALVYRETGSAEEKKLPMLGDEKLAFSVTRPRTETDFEYCIEAGSVRSEWHTVSAVDPVQLASGTQILLKAPAYAAARFPDVSKPNLGEISALQYSQAAFTFQFDRVPVDVHLEWRSAEMKPEQTPEMVPVKLAVDGRSATAEQILKGDGTLKLILFGEKKIRTETLVAVRATPDVPPKFERIVGMPEKQRQVQPDATLPLELAIADDVAVAGAVLEIAPPGVDDEKLFHREPLKLAGFNTGRVEGKIDVSLAGKAKIGQVLRVRLRVKDNRSLPEFHLSPHEITYPEKGWAELEITATALPLSEQDILAKKLKIDEQLDAIWKQVFDAARDVSKLKNEIAGRDALPLNQTTRLTEDKDKAREAAKNLEAVAEELERVPELRRLADAARNVAQRPLQTAQDELTKAEREPKADPRDEATEAADKALKQALLEVDELKKANEALAQSRLDRDRLDRLEQAQRELAEEAKKPEARTPDLIARQAELDAKLKKLLAESETLKGAAAATAQEKSGQLAEQLQRLADAQKKLNAEIQAADANRPREGLDAVAEKQKALNEQAAKLAEKSAAAARIAQTPPINTKPFEQVDELLKKTKSIEALTEQEKAARELERLAEALSKAAEARKDAAAAAKQLSQWQEDLQKRSDDLAKQNPTGVPNEARARLAAEQNAIRKAADELPLPQNDLLEKARKNASEQLGDAAEKVRRDPASANDAMQQAAESLKKLAEATPSNAVRNKAAREELQKLQREQEAIAREATEAAKQTQGKNADDPATRDELKKKLAAAAEKQDELSKKLKALDTPTQTERKDRAAQATEQASDDLKRGLPQDIPASQQAAKRQLDRLREALDGQKTADEKAEELERLQRKLTEELTQVRKPSAVDLQRLQRMQRDLRDQLNKLNAPDEANALNQARDAANAAEQALRKPDADVDELKKKSKASEEALNKLAERLRGSESDEERLDRLAEKLKKEAELARENATPSQEKKNAAERDRAELAQTRTGEAQAAKQKALDALEELKRAPNAEKQKELQDAAAKAVDELAKAVKKNGDRTAKANPEAKPQPMDRENQLPTEQDAERARELAREQRELRKELSQAAERNAKTDKTQSAEAMAKHQAEQEKLAKEAGDVANQLQDAAKSTPKGEDAKPLNDAANAARAAAEQMQQAKQARAQGQKPGANEAQAAASKKLEEAAENARAGAGPAGKKPASPGNAQEAMDAAKQAGEQMQLAQKQLGQGKPSSAQGAMQQAADALKQASQALGSGEKGKPGSSNAGNQPGGADGSKPASTDAVPNVLVENIGKSWGDLPGEVKTRITQELKAKYGEDYARIIKLYFEQIADRK